jgi:hypothetical protein
MSSSEIASLKNDVKEYRVQVRVEAMTTNFMTPF